MYSYVSFVRNPVVYSVICTDYYGTESRVGDTIRVTCTFTSLLATAFIGMKMFPFSVQSLHSLAAHHGQTHHGENLLGSVKPGPSQAKPGKRPIAEACPR